MYHFEPVMVVCMVKSEMEWLATCIQEREKKLNSQLQAKFYIYN